MLPVLSLVSDEVNSVRESKKGIHLASGEERPKAAIRVVRGLVLSGIGVVRTVGVTRSIFCGTIGNPLANVCVLQTFKRDILLRVRVRRLVSGSNEISV